MNRARARRLSSFVVVGVLTAAMASSSGPASGDTIRTDTSLGGFSVKTNAAPFKVLIDDPASAIPHEGPAIVEADPSYTAATLETGPTARALASSLWPGTLLGDGVGAATNGGVAGYPLKADAKYPDKPYTDTAHGCLQPDQPATCAGDGGALMSAQALGLDVKALAKMVPAEVPGVALGAMSSVSTATVKDGVAIGTSASHLSDVSLLDGMISIGSVSTTISVRSNGKKAVSDGQTVVSGLSIMGMGYVVDDKGARPTGVPGGPSVPVPTGVADPAQQLGITISGLSQDHTQDVSTATRDAKGLRITLDTVLIRSILDQATPSPLKDALYSLFSQVPPIPTPAGDQDVQGYLFYLMSTTPKITFIIGAGSGVSAATEPLTFTWPDLPIGGGFAPPPVTGGATTPTAPVTSPVLPVTGGAPAPVVAPGNLPSAVKAAAKDPFHGLSPGLLLLVLALAGAGGWGLVRLQSAALLGAAGAGRCNDDLSPTLPDLRGA